MNSLQQLNNYSNQLVSYTDQRPEQIVYDSATTINPTVSISEGGTISAPIGRNIREIVGLNANVVYSIDLTGLTGTSLTWPNIPTGVVTSVAGNIYTASNITTVDQWNTIKSPSIAMPRDYDGVWFMNSNVRMYLGANIVAGNTATWTSTVTVIDLPEMTNPITPTVYDIGVLNSVTNPPQITNTENTSTTEIYTMRVSSNATSAFGNLSSSGSLGGVSTWTQGNLTLTLSGNRGQVNSHLSTLKFFSSNVGVIPWYLTYTLTNPVSGKVTVRNQSFVRNTVSGLSSATPVYYYKNNTNYIYTAPTVIDTTPGGAGEQSYTLIVQSVPVTISSLATYGANIGGNSVWDGLDKTLTVTGNAQQINSRISNLAVTPTTGANTVFNMNYILFSADGDSSVRNQLFLANNTVSAGNVTPNVPPPITSVITSEVLEPRHYLNNQALKIFTGNMFSYTGNITGTNVFTWTFSSDLGVFNQGELPTTNMGSYYRFTQPGEIYTHSETRINQAPFFNMYISESGLTPLYFWPIRDTSNDGYATFKFYRNSILEFTQDIALVGITRANTIPGTGITNLESASITDGTQMAWRFNDPTGVYYGGPIMYLNANILLVPGGGAGGGNSSVRGGGGAAGIPVLVSNVRFDTTGNLTSALNISIGAGGSAGVYTRQADPGGNTTAIINGITYTAIGGQGGFPQSLGGFGGNNTIYHGGLTSGGGGAGAGGHATGVNGGPGYYSTVANIKFNTTSQDFWVGSGGAGPTGNANIAYGGGGNVTTAATGGLGGGGAGGNNGANGGIFTEWFEV